MNSIRLITRADDAGLNRTSNRAIRASVKQGIVRNISLLATGPAIEDAAEVFGDLSGIVDFGLHVCLTSEWRHPRFRPVSKSDEAKTLVRDDGSFPASVKELAGLSPSADAVALEVSAQFDRLASLGFQPTYLDEHMLIGDVAGVEEVLSAFAAEKGLVYSRSLEKSGAVARPTGWKGPGPHPGTELADYLSGLDEGTYLIIGHPGFKADEMQRLRLDNGSTNDVLQERNRQRRMFADIEIVDYCENAGVALLRYTEL